ncbi:hypothetical protein HORIV_04420 [Vreelandella olivaria]|uniref:Coenzyme Q-binding protein COQ10 START domain-containing protein n=1 Tax=Vreelandella olivaria TaxID=390919 RepID=A0ABN5WM03_9GAMM|nr:hypothetical protein HORIV_04420 [Halomonas olivaria]
MFPMIRFGHCEVSGEVNANRQSFRLSAAHPQKMFDLVNDFERYPEFLPGCRQARLLEHDDVHLIGEMTLGRAGVEQTITTRNELLRPSVLSCRW